MRLLAGIGAIAIVVAVAAAIFFFGGFYNVAATQEDPGIIKWVLVKVREASINRHAGVTPAVNLADPAVIKEGAQAFATRGCVNCHGAPGETWQKFSEAMRPDPPDLADVIKELEPGQLFWVIKHGINMTGMPGFALIGAEDKEIWSIVAFVKKLPEVSEADYKAWTTPK